MNLQRLRCRGSHGCSRVCGGVRNCTQPRRNRARAPRPLAIFPLGGRGRRMVVLGRRATGLAAVVALSLGIGLTGGADSASASELPHVVLSASSPDAIHFPDGSWVIPIKSPRSRTLPGQPAGFLCRGTYIDPEIVARGRGTAVHFAAKFFCNRPVSYTVTVGVTNFYEETPDGPVVAHPGGLVTGSGLSQQPYVEGFSPPCKNNRNSGWQPYDRSKIEVDAHNGGGTRVTVGCRV